MHSPSQHSTLGAPLVDEGRGGGGRHPRASARAIGVPLGTPQHTTVPPRNHFVTFRHKQAPLVGAPYRSP